MMTRSRQFARTDAAVVLVVALFLVGNLAVVGPSGRERAKRAVCLANLKQLTAAWVTYADENDSKIVNGEAEFGSAGTCSTPTSGHHKEEKYWVGTDCHSGYMTGAKHPESIQNQAIRAGALFPYCWNVNLYHCPNGAPGTVRTYSIVDAMNGLYRVGTRSADGAGVKVGETVLWVKRTTEIITPGPAQRLVLMEEDRPTPDSYAVHYLNPRWWDPPYVRHGNGMHVSFADGHSAHWQWEAAETIAVGTADNPMHQFAPQTPEGRSDLERMQTAVWGRLGYVPSQP